MEKKIMEEIHKDVLKKYIDEIQKYFKRRILAGEFNIVESEELRITIKVDNQYLFTIWVAEEAEGIEQFGYNNFINLGEFQECEKQQIWNQIEPHIANEKEIKRQKLTEKIEALQEELKNLE